MCPHSMNSSGRLNWLQLNSLSCEPPRSAGVSGIRCTSKHAEVLLLRAVTWEMTRRPPLTQYLMSVGPLLLSSLQCRRPLLSNSADYHWRRRQWCWEPPSVWHYYWVLLAHTIAAMAAALCTHTVVLFGNSVLFLGRRLGLDFNESQEPHHSLNYYLLLASFLWVLNFLSPFHTVISLKWVFWCHSRKSNLIKDGFNIWTLNVKCFDIMILTWSKHEL